MGMFLLFIIVAAIGGSITGRSVAEGDAGMAFVGILIVMIGVLGNMGVFG